MKLAELHSHLNGLEYVIIQRSGLWQDLQRVMEAVNVACCSVETENIANVHEPQTCDPLQFNTEFAANLRATGWQVLCPAYLRTENSLPTQQSSDSHLAPQILVKDRIGLSMHFGLNSTSLCEPFAPHLAFYVRDEIDVGIELLPMKSLQAQMSSGPAYYEGELYNVIRNGRGVPSVPLVIIGLAA